MRELREHAGQIVRGLCVLLAAIVAYEVIGIGFRWNPFHGVAVPDLPMLAEATNTAAGGPPATNVMAAGPAKGTNGIVKAVATNGPAITNGLRGTNISVPLLAASSNGVATNISAKPVPATNPTVAVATAMTSNVPVAALTNLGTNFARTNGSPGMTNFAGALAVTNHGTNLATANGGVASNEPAGKPVAGARHPGTPFLAGQSFPGAMGRHRPDLPPAIQARISRITESEILAPVIRPLPMALLGIAGDVAFLRSASGQTGLVKEGDSLDDIKLLRIGINRVLIEQAGQKKELLIFSGYGGESLLPKDSTNETIHP